MTSSDQDKLPPTFNRLAWSNLAAQSAEQVAEAGYRGLMDGRRTVVPGAINKLATFLIRIIPRSVILSFVDHRQKRRRSARSA